MGNWGLVPLGALRDCGRTEPPMGGVREGVEVSIHTLLLVTGVAAGVGVNSLSL